MKVAFIIKGTAGKRLRRKIAALQQVISNLTQVEACRIFETTHQGHAILLTDEIVQEGFHTLVAVVADDTVTGAGVVMAQRVEQLAETGGLCITGAVRESLSGRLPVEIENLGPQELKGFDEPVGVYRVRRSDDVVSSAATEQNPIKRAQCGLRPLRLRPCSRSASRSGSEGRGSPTRSLKPIP